jgi:cell division transport system permease protein
MTVFFKNEANDSIMKNFGTELNQAFVKNYKYVTKEAAQEHTDIIGEDFMTFLEKTIAKLL